ncbi:MAG: TIGR03617 family F420-dependent LLM class oxidoreductase [Spongiibacteraceae bacterium]
MARALKVDAGIGFPGEPYDTERLVQRAGELEAAGFDALLTAEVAHDPFLPLALMTHHTAKIALRTSIAVALSRNPMTMAALAHDINAWSRGRFTLGLGSQIKPHITKRFGMPWFGPAKQMREFIEALHAIWDCWYDGKPLDYQGEMYSHKLMTPEFTPANTAYGRPKVVMAAVGPLMIKTAATIADGIIVHAFCTEKHLREVMLPQLEIDLTECGRSRQSFEIQLPMFIASGRTEEELEKEKQTVRARLGFYASTPAYKTVLDTHGWGDLQPQLAQMIKQGRWSDLGAEVSDEMLHAFAVVGEPKSVAEQVRSRYSDLIDRVVLPTHFSADVLSEQLQILRGA